MQDLARNYRALRERGIRVILVSPQSPEHAASLAKRFDAPMEFWVDQNLAAARALGILDAKGLPMGMEVLGYDQDTVLPTSILLDEKGIVFHDDQTDSYRIRPEPENSLAAFDARSSGRASAGGVAWDSPRDRASCLVPALGSQDAPPFRKARRLVEVKGFAQRCRDSLDCAKNALEA